MRGSIVFLSPMCLLDNSSGAAISSLNFMTVLSKAGYRCTSFTASFFDQRQNVPLEKILGQTIASDNNRGKLAIFTDQGITHNIFLTKSTRSKDMSPDEQIKFIALWKNWLNENRPDAILTYGNSGFSKEIQRIARDQCKTIILYLGNAEYDDASLFAETDTIICPSEFLKRHYKKSLGIESTVVRTIMNHERLATPTQSQKSGFVTFMNPIPQKGLTLFIRLADLARRERPDIRFLVTEGRMPRELLKEWNADIAALPNVQFIPNTDDVRNVYAQTSILIVPSFWQEGFPRSIIEAQLSGIPVIASTQGGCEEALNGAGLALEIPENCKKNYNEFPSDETVRQWFEAICLLWDDEDAYRRAQNRALHSAEAFHPDKMIKDAVEYFSRLIESNSFRRNR